MHVLVSSKYCIVGRSEPSFKRRYGRHLTLRWPTKGRPQAALAQYYATVAQIEANQVSTDGTDLVGEESQIAGQEVTLGDEEETASVDETLGVDGAVQTEMNTLLPEQVQAVKNADGDLAQAVTDDADAQAAYQTSVADAVAQYYQDKAAATRDDYDKALASAAASADESLEPMWADVQFETTKPGEVSSALAAAAAAYNSAYVSARSTTLGGYGDAEITEATSIGAAEVALATTEGGDEVNLASEEAGVADTLAGQEASADETLVSTTGSVNATTAETVAGDEASTTSSEGDEEKTAQQQLSSEEVTTAGQIAGAQADYAISMAQIAAAALPMPAGEGPGTGALDQAGFSSRWAQGYVQWLSDLKPSFVADATAVAQAAAQDEEDTLAADVNLADEQATANTDFVDAEAPQSAQESDTLTEESDAYSTSVVVNTGNDQIGTAQADKTQMIDLANAGAAYLLASAQADKARAVNGYEQVPGTQQQYTDAVAQAKLTLSDSQADADLAWIDGKALADEQFSLADTSDWQTMSDGQAATIDQYALEVDGDAQTENDTLAQDDAGQMTAYALADQTEGNSDASAEADFQIAQANETAAIWGQIVGWASPSGGSPGLPGLPWMQSQAGLAGVEATWAVTAAANYQNYVSALGTAEMNYANTNSADFVNEIKTIDGLDKTAADGAANADEQLTTALTNDEATFEDALAPASMTFDTDVGQAQHDYRQALALADYNLTVQTAAGDPDAQTNFSTALAAAQTGEQAGYNHAYVDFATPMMPAITAQGIADAAAEYLDTKTLDDENLTDILQNNAAVDGYQDEESVAYASEQKADAQALYTEQVSNAVGHAAAIAAYAQANPSPWADQAWEQALSDMALQIAQASSTLTRSVSEADAQSTEEQVQNDATETEDDANAQTEHDQNLTQAAADEESADAQAAAVDAVFQDLPDTLIAPADGPVFSVTPDFQIGYEANDFYLPATNVIIGQEIKGVGSLF
jgi:hypothetical protein